METLGTLARKALWDINLSLTLLAISSQLFEWSKQSQV